MPGLMSTCGHTGADGVPHQHRHPRAHLHCPPQYPNFTARACARKDRRYNRGQRFGRHIDESVELGGGRYTKYTLLIYLSTPSGGETVFYGASLPALTPCSATPLLCNDPPPSPSSSLLSALRVAPSPFSGKPTAGAVVHEAE